MGKRYRYPGSKPFEGDERLIFFGREDDIKNLTQMVQVEPLVVLYGKSGLGKSSLLNAGVVPALQETGECEVFSLRFGSYIEGSENPMPLDRVLKVIRQDRHTSSFMRKVSRDNHSLWHSLKNIQIAEGLEKDFVLIFDQFEELFTYPAREIKRLKEALVDVLNSALPQDLRNKLKDKMQSGEADILSKEEMAALYKPMVVKVVFSIRSDKMSLLNRLRDYIPNILQRVYELRPLTREQAEDAILSPAELGNDLADFYSPRFDYEDEALDQILDFLTKKNEKSIESFQLQILCQYIEETIVIKEYDTLIASGDIGDLESIYQNYYDNQIDKLPSEEKREKARVLIEDGLIFEEEARRLSLYEGQIKAVYGVDDSLLSMLVDTHIIRSEPNPTGGFSYELSHDTLVPPILRSKERRKKEEEALIQAAQEKQEYKRLQKEQSRAFKQKLRWIGIVVSFIVVPFIAYESYQAFEEKNELADANAHLQEALVREEQLKKKNALLASSSMNELVDKIDLLEAQYKNLVDSMKYLDSASNNIAVDTAHLRKTILVLQQENKQLEQQYRGLLTKTSTQKREMYLRLKELNQQLFDKLYVTEYKSNKTWIELNTGIIQQYKNYAEEIK